MNRTFACLGSKVIACVVVLMLAVALAITPEAFAWGVEFSAAVSVAEA